VTARTLQEWIGATPDTPVPPRVKARVFLAYDGRCGICERKLASGDKWECDHVQALVNGGENRESNLQPACEWCHRAKTREDVAEKATVARKRAKHIGVRKTRQKIKSRGFGKSDPQRSATRPIDKWKAWE